MTMGARIRKLREAAGMTQEQLAKRMGYEHRSSITKIEKGQGGLSKDLILKFAEVLDTTPEYIMGTKEPNLAEETVTFGVIGELKAGYERNLIEEYDETIEIPVAWLRGRPKSDYMVLRIIGDSMYPDYQDGDLVLILRQTTMNHSGQIGAVIYEDTHVTLKRIEYVMGEDWMRLVPINKAYPPIMVTDERLEHCRVLGPVKMLIRRVRQ